MKTKKKVCVNPACKAEYVPGPYGDRQKVCRGTYAEKCSKCPGKDCKRCHGSGRYRQSCKNWYRSFWAQTRKPPRGIPAEDWAKIEKVARREPIRHACLIVARESGMRKGELLGITWGDVVGRKGKIQESFVIRGQWDDRDGFKPTKTANSRIGYLLPRAVEVISKLKRGKSENRIFPFWESEIYRWFIGIQKRLRIQNPETGYPYRFHDIRHTLGTELVHGHGDRGLTIAKEILGHRNVNTTIMYSKQTAEETILEAMKLRGKGNGRAH